MLHEVTELRILLRRDPYLLSRSRRDALAFLRTNEDAHVQALAVEYTYLQQAIRDHLGEDIGIAALVRVNSTPDDYDRLLESDFPRLFFEPTGTETARAKGLLARLRALPGEGQPCELVTA